MSRSPVGNLVASICPDRDSWGCSGEGEPPSTGRRSAAGLRVHLAVLRSTGATRRLDHRVRGGTQRWSPACRVRAAGCRPPARGDRRRHRVRPAIPRGHHRTRRQRRARDDPRGPPRPPCSVTSRQTRVRANGRPGVAPYPPPTLTMRSGWMTLRRQRVGRLGSGTLPGVGAAANPGHGGPDQGSGTVPGWIPVARRQRAAHSAESVNASSARLRSSPLVGPNAARQMAAARSSS